MFYHTGHIGIVLLLLLQPVHAANERWMVEDDTDVASLMAVSLRSAIAASNDVGMQAAFNRIRLRQSVARHPHREVIGEMFLDVYARVTRLPINEVAPLREVVHVDIDADMADLLSERTAAAMNKTTKLSWKLAVLELLVEAKPVGYKRLSESILVRVATGTASTSSDRARALVAVARGFNSGDMTTQSVRLLTEGLADENYDMKRLCLGVLGQVGNAETLQVLRASRDQNAFDAVVDNIDFAISKLSYNLEDELSGKVKILRTVLEQDQPRSLLELNWALDQVISDGRVELLGLLKDMHEVHASEDRFLEQEFARAISGLRSGDRDKGGSR